MRATSILVALTVATGALAALVSAARRSADPPPRSAQVIRLAPLAWRAEKACATLQRRVSFRVLCPRLLPRAVVGFPGQPPPPLVVFLLRSSPTRYTGLDFSYGAPWETPGWQRHRWRNRPCCFLHFVIERLEGRVPAAARPAVVGARQGRLLPASSTTFYSSPYFANHVRFFFRERSVPYVATLHTFGNRETTALLGRIVASLRAGPFRASPRGVVLNRPQMLAPASGGVWTTSIDPGRLVHVDRRGSMTRVVRVRFVPLDVAVASGSLWVTGYRGSRAFVCRVDAGTGRILGTISTRTFAKAVAADTRGVWVLNSAPFFRRGSLVRIDPAGNHIAARVPLGRAPAQIALGPASVWVTDILDGTLVRVDRRSGRVVARIRVGGSPFGLALGAGAVWVTNSDDGTVSRVDPGRNRVVATIRVGPNPFGIAAGHGRVWVANLGDGTITRIDPRSNRAAVWARVGGDPFALAATAGSVWVTINGEQTLRHLPLRS